MRSSEGSVKGVTEKPSKAFVIAGILEAVKSSDMLAARATVWQDENETT